ncbi:GDNF family receptor alpha-4 [Collichthys lucidus]|uniref:GDNF family receptor alpha-4 n=1 Tax=Collichthys lucidus TaxID=240159 RepID=A0A4U5V839_COLLU|nr:GDNF family receptor alpha-4 [Collichthys lucidus]
MNGMMIFGLLLHVLSHGGAPVSASLDCLVAEQSCIQEPSCMALYRLLEYCAAEEAVAPLGPDSRRECLEAQNSLQRYRPLQVCKCQRGSRREEHCLRVYWTVRFAVYNEYDVSPYEELQLSLVRNIEMSRMASIIAASSLSVDGQNQCLKAAQDCGQYERCGALRSEYVVACTKRAAVSTNSCNRQKCHKALRRFLERVPEEYSFALLFCTCSDTLCGERRRKTIVPSCSYEENAQGDAYAGLIGTIMTPNYVSNSSTGVSQWCSCDGSGNEWQSCQRVLNMFNSNTCLRNAISSVGVSATPPVENTPVPTSQATPRIDHERVHTSINTFPEFNSMEDSEEDEAEDEDDSEGFIVIPPYSDKDLNVESRARGSKRGAASQAVLVIPILLLGTLVNFF